MKVSEGSLKELALEAGVAELFVDLILPPRSSTQPRPYDHFLEMLIRMDSNLATISTKMTDFLSHSRNSLLDGQDENNKEDGLAKAFLGLKRLSLSAFDENNIINTFFDSIENFDFKKINSLLDDKPSLLFEISKKNRTSLISAIVVNSEVMVRTFLNIAFKIAEKNLRILQLLEVPDIDFEMNSFQLATINGNKNMIDILEGARLHSTKDSAHMHDFSEVSIPLKNYWSMCFKNDPETVAKLEEVRTKVDPILKSGKNWNWFDKLQFKKLRARSYLITSDEDASIEQSMLWGNEYVLHQLFGSSDVGDEGIMSLLKNICKCLGEELLPYIMYLWDNHGRTPLHVLTDNFDIEDYQMTTIFKIIDFHCPNVLQLDILDFAGRTPLYRAATQGNFIATRVFCEDLRTNLNATTSGHGEHFPKHSSIIKSHSSSGVTSLHIAVLHNHRNVVEALINARKGHKVDCEKDNTSKLDMNSVCGHSHRTFKTTPFQLAAFKGHTQIIQLFLKEREVIDKCIISDNKKIYLDSKISALSLATAGANPLSVQMFLANERVDPFAIDVHGNTALHYAARAFDEEFEEIYFYNFADYINIEHLQHKLPKKNKRSSELIGCMELLMQAGLDMNKTNHAGYCPELSSSTPEDVRQWWYEKFTKQTQEVLSNLSGAATAVSVTAALVSTASFVGPLQPPLGFLSGDDNDWLNGYAQYTHPSVEAFMFCDNLTFYFSMSSIILSMIPFLPISHEGILREIRVVQKSVQAAVVVLFMSVVFLICAFFCAAVSVVPKDYWRYKSLTMFTTGSGGMICVVTLSLFCIRLLRVIKIKNPAVLKAYNAILQNLKSDKSARQIIDIVHTHMVVKRVVLHWKKIVKRRRILEAQRH